MAADGFAALVQRLHPGVPVRQLERAAKVRKDTLGYYLKPSTRVVRMPTAPAILDLARVLGCDAVEVTEAFAADLELPWTRELTEQQQRVLRTADQLNPDGVEVWITMGNSLKARFPATTPPTAHA